jgi:hypothetical protein
LGEEARKVERGKTVERAKGAGRGKVERGKTVERAKAAGRGKVERGDEAVTRLMTWRRERRAKMSGLYARLMEK